MIYNPLKTIMNDIFSTCDKNINDLASLANKLDLGLMDAKDPIGALIKFGHKIYSNRQIENLKNFLTEVDRGTISENELTIHKFNMYSSNILKDELSKLILITTEYDNTIKSILLGKLYVNFLRRKISKKELFRLANLLNNFIIDDMELLHYIVEHKPTEPEQVDDDSALNRLSSLGLINQPSPIWAKVTDGKQPPLYFLLNDGKLLYNYSIKEYLAENQISAE